jgi:YggT family protein
MRIVCGLANLYLIVIFVRIVLSWFPIGPDGALSTVQNITYQLTEPVLGPLRRIIPPIRVGAAAIDLSALILVLGYTVLLMPLLCG